MKKIRFYYHFGVCQVLGIIKKDYSEIYYFNISKLAKFFLSILGLSKKVRIFDFILAEVRDEQGESYCTRIFSKHTISICNEIRDSALKNDKFLCLFAKVFDQDKIFTYMTKYVQEEIRDMVIFCNVINWHMLKHKQFFKNDVVFFVPSSPYAHILRQFALKECNVSLVFCRSMGGVWSLVWSLVKNMGKFFISIIEPLGPKSLISQISKCHRPTHQKPMVGISYAGFGITFSKTERCEFPWLLESQIPYDQVYLYFRRDRIPIQDEALRLLSEKGISYTSFSYSFRNKKAFTRQVGEYQATPRVTRILLFCGLRSLYFWLRACIAGQCPSFRYLNVMLKFVIRYARAYDFYCAKNIAINVDYDVYERACIAEQQALADLGGVSINFQLSNHPLPNVLFATCADVRFIFGSHYREILQRSGTHNKYFICYGYLNDYAFVAAKEKSEQLRKMLRSKGAEFIVSYFDENSSNDRMSGIPHVTSAHIYKKLFNWVIQDETIGLICSPKAPVTLFKRISEIRDFIERAKKTGRCIFMESAYLVKSYPTESAQASDVAIAHLAGGTVAMESYLSGVRTVYLDLEGRYSYPEYIWGKGSIVFDDVDALINAINIYRQHKESLSELGSVNMIPIMKQKDPFQDGYAARRMGQYIYWLLEKMGTGVSRDDVIVYANEQYGKSWGREHIADSLV